MRNNKFAVLAAFFILCAVNALGQGITADSLAARLSRQVYDFPQEKIHVTTDRAYYFGGDTVWMRAFIADASTHVPVTASKYVYVELTNPFDTLVTRIKIMESGGVYKGYIPLDAQIAEGDYTLTAYTMFMENMNDEYFFRKNIYVSSPYSVQSEIRPVFSRDGNAVKAEVEYIDKATGKPREYENMKFTTCTGSTEERMNRGGGQSVIELRGRDLAKPYVLIAFGEHKKFFRLPYAVNGGYSVAFYPEGGYIAPGAECRVAFKAEDGSGAGIDVTGEVKDGRGGKVADMKVLHNGMGTFVFTPSAGETYTAEVKDRNGRTQTFALPAVNSSAATVKVVRKGDNLEISSCGNTPPGSFIIVQQRGRMLACAPIDNANSQTFSVKDFPAGVAQVLMLDAHANTLSERLVFIRDAAGRKVRMNPERKEYGQREKVRMSIKLDDFSAAKGSVAVSVTDNKTVPADNAMSIETQMLLQSDIKGTVENPQYYFSADNKNADRDLDVLMLTQGWRRYDVPQALLGNYCEPDVPLEIGQEVSGIVKSLWRGKPVAGANVGIMAPKVGFSDVAVTDADGQFHFNGFNFPDGTGFIIQAFSDKGKKMMNFDVFNQTFPKIGFATPLASAEVFTAKDFSESNTQRINSDVYLRQILLDEITVIGHRRKGPASIYEALSAKSFDSDYIEDSRATNLDEIVRLIPGVQLRNNNLYYRGSLSAVAVNGVIEDYTPDVSPYEELKNKYSIDAIKSVDFIPSYSATLFGPRAVGGGVLNLTLKDGSEIKKDAPSLFVKVHLPLGYQKPAEFYSPKYDGTSFRPEGTDMRSTLCWLPSVSIGKDGTAAFDFYSSDVQGTSYTVKVEGLTESGEIIRSDYELDVK